MSIATTSITTSNRSLSKITRIWFGIAFSGQLIFAIYIFIQYILSGIIGDLDQWGAASTGGYVTGDQMGNVAFGIHVILAGIITLGGPLQIWPRIRNQFPNFHRVNGRVYIGAAYLISIAGLYLTWVRGTVGDTAAHVMVSINGIIIIIAATNAIRHAIAGRISQHQFWAMILFIAMSGVYFFRVFLNAWLITLQDTWIDFDSFTGRGLDIVGFCSYIAPSVMVVIYFIVQDSKKTLFKQTLSGFFALLSILFIVGIIGATFLMWWPEMIR